MSAGVRRQRVTRPSHNVHNVLQGYTLHNTAAYDDSFRSASRTLLDADTRRCDCAGGGAVPSAATCADSTPT